MASTLTNNPGEPPEQALSAAIELVALSKSYHGFHVVDAISFKAGYGRIFGLLGPNGAGKSTTVKMLVTLSESSAGRAFVNGFDIEKQTQAVRTSLGYVPQLISADGNLTAYENLNFSAKLYGLLHSERKPRIYEALTFMGLFEHKDKIVKNFSGGMIRKLEIAQAILHKPRVLFLDEPTVGLDILARSTVWEKLRYLKSELNTSILITTHSMEEAEILCDDIAIMQQGKIVVQGDIKSLKETIGEHASLSDVFVHYCDNSMVDRGNYKDARQTRFTVDKLG